MVATNDTAELALVGSLDSQVVIVTHHFRMTEVGTGRTLQDLVDKWQAAAQSQWLACQRTGYTLTKLRARHICGSVPLDATTEELVGSVGTFGGYSAGAAAQAWMACVVRERTASAGKERRGRFFVPVSDEADYVGNSIAAATITVIQAYVTAVAGAFLPGGTEAGKWAMVVHSRKLASVPGTQCQASSTIVTQLAVQSALTTQRSRRPRPA